MWDFAEDNLRLVLSEDEYEKIRWSHDFPIEKDKESFEQSRSRILRHIADNHSHVYQFLERAQPYHDKEQHLWLLKILSNYSGHTVPIEAKPIRATIVCSGRFEACILGNQVIVSNRDGSLHTTCTEPLKLDAFLVILSSTRGPELAPFATDPRTRPE